MILHPLHGCSAAWPTPARCRAAAAPVQSHQHDAPQNYVSYLVQPVAWRERSVHTRPCPRFVKVVAATPTPTRRHSAAGEHLAEVQQLLRSQDLARHRHVAPGNLRPGRDKAKRPARLQPAGDAGTLLRLQQPQVWVCLCSKSSESFTSGPAWERWIAHDMQIRLYMQQLTQSML